MGRDPRGSAELGVAQAVLRVIERRVSYRCGPRSLWAPETSSDT